MVELKHLAKYRRYLLKDTNLLAVQGSIAPVITGMDTYNSRYDIAHPQADLKSSIQEILAATALAALSLAERESWGWSLSFRGTDAGFFVGIEPEGMICLRVLGTERERASGMIQRQKAGLPLTQSHIRPRTSRPRDAVEQYFSEVEQTKTRLVIGKDGNGMLVHSLPGSDFKAVQDLNAEDLTSFIDNAIEEGRAVEAGEVFIFYECRCSEEIISRMVDKMAEPERRGLFRNSHQRGIECPRCGRKYTVRRT